jgi:predicted dehydrogenase
MRIGMIGCGTVAGYGHIPALAEGKDFTLAALADTRPERLKELGEKFNVSSLYTDYRELLANPDIDAVGVATPVGSHHEVVMAALAAGKHVFCEKPLANEVDLCWEMVNAAQQAGLILAVNFELRVSNAMERIRQIAQSGEIGKVHFLRLTYNWGGPRWSGIERHRMMMIEGKGPIFDCGVHFFDLVRWFSQAEYKDVRAAGMFVEDYPYPDHVVATCRMSNGAVAIIDESWVYAHTVTDKNKQFIHRIEMEGDDGTLLEQDDEIIVQNSAGVRREKLAAQGKAFGTMYHLFAEAIKTGQYANLSSGEDGAHAVAAASAALESVVAEDERIFKSGVS